VTSVGWVGLGKLGAPCAAALQKHGGHRVVGFDVRLINDADATFDWDDQPPTDLVRSIADVVEQTDGVVFVAVQTPHSPRYGGEIITPEETRDFEYQYLVAAVRSVAVAAASQRKNVTLVVVSTVLPGTFDRDLRPLLNSYVTPVYHPFFIAMGTVVDDFVQPEMLLLGVDHVDAADPVLALYNFHEAPAPVLSIASAELAKVAYNTFITTKIVFANTLMELCDGTGADVDEVTDALSYGTQRITSSAYMTAGMGDGGGCHPRDNVAMSDLAQRLDLSFDLMGMMIRARELQTDWLAQKVLQWQELTSLPVVILGKSYKPNVDMTVGSPALLLAELLIGHQVPFIQYDPLVDGTPREEFLLERPAVFFVATRHAEFASYTYPAGSVVIDPFGYVEFREGVTVVRPGRK
jgi:UDPglucose 6-dehydrogenase